ncbi:PHD finger protein 20-like isoform X3 [Plodia interpunctella]|uniref:PHD finger protein 20-like isoform X3 n=1 Tax=Plodia interpunctella TaxID=58824 RepID=UPI002368CA38|nr:PHD finger protein 20-like isoform X3 [Plodia interpunctella]
MVLRKCSILHCISCSTRKEDIGVTYHKYPKDVSLRAVWAEVSKIKIRDIQLTTYVCSRHFRKSDFQMYKDSKYVLKSDSIPSIFPWTTMDTDTDSSKADDTNTESVASKTVTDNVIMETDDETKEIKALNSSKESDGENLDAIRKYIEEQEKEIQELTAQSSEKKNEETKKVAEVKEIKSSTEETMDVASSMMDMILSSSSVALSVGSQVEAKDFAEFWHPAEIMEVDYDEMEVLVRYDNPAKSRHDEWISVSSPRLRPRGTSEALPGETPQIDTAPEGTPQDMTAAATIPDPQAVTEELKVEDKVKLTFVVGERCLARWRDNRRFMATITKDLGEGKYEIAFDDGFQWKCAVSRLCKYKENLSVDTGSLTPSASVPSPIQHGVGPSGAPLLPAYHTHLFDPNRDYLGSKSERREMKRKLNVKELFNIGQKKRKKIPEEKPQKVMTPKKQKVVKKKITPSKPDSKKKVSRNDIPEAVASIIGTVNEELEQKDKLDSTAAESVVTEAKDDIKDNMDVENEIVETSSEITISETEGKAQELDVVTHSQIDTTVANNVLSTSVNDNSICENAADMLTIENEALVIGNNESSPEKDSPCAVASETIKTEDLVDKTETVGETHKTIPEEELKLEIFEKQDEVKHEEVIDKIKEVITKIEGDLNHVQVESPKAEIKIEGIKEEAREKSKKLSKIKKGKKLRLLQEKKVKKQVEKVKNELEEMKRQVEEMRKQMLMKTGGVEGEGPMQMPESFLLPGEWCCKWVNGQPVGKVCELESDPREEAKGGLPRRSVQVEDKRLPEGWTKHMVRRSLGHSAGKWDVVLVSPDNRRFHTKTDMRNYLENNPDEELKQYEHALMDFGVHLKLSRRMGWFTTTPGGTDDIPVMTLPAGTLNTTSPLVKRRKLSLKNRPRQIKIKMKEKKRKPARKGYEIPSAEHLGAAGSADGEYMVVDTSAPLPPSDPPLEDGYVYVGSLKVQIIENLLRCPAEGCFKNFRNNTLIKMHIKHYHRELRKMLGRTPKVADLASARALPTDVPLQKGREPELKTLKVKIAKIHNKEIKNTIKKEEPKQEVKLELPIETPTTPVKDIEMPKQDSPKLRHALVNKPLKRPRVLLPVRRAEPEFEPVEEIEEAISEPMQMIDIQDFEAAISTHTVTKPTNFDKIKVISEDDEWYGMNSDVDTQSSFPRSGSPDSKSMDQKPVSSESNEEHQKDMDNYTYTENGERIKIVHMKREEIINCHCGFREEDGLMVQCELCLCWQHALCHNIQKESEVPEKYTCSICLNPWRGRRSKRFVHDQDRLYEGALPGGGGGGGAGAGGGGTNARLRRAHELGGNLLRLQDALHALQVKYHVAVKKDHPKLYLWAKDWENGDINMTQERLNSEYSDLNIMLNSIGKENMRIKVDDLNNIDMDHDRVSQRDGLNPVVLSGLVSSPGALELPLSGSELERLAGDAQDEQELPRGPQPEAAIENGPCRERLLRHIQRCQAIIDARLDSIEAQVAELESQDPSFEDDETADYFPRTKQTIQMLMRDLDTMEELGAS